MAFADAIRIPAPTVEQFATLLEGIFGSTYATPTTSWTPTFTGGGGSWSGTATIAKYLRIGKLVIYFIQSAAVAFTGTSAYVTFTLPLAAAASSTPVPSAGWIIPDTNNVKGAAVYRGSSTTQMRVALYDGANLTNGANVSFAVLGVYEAA